MRSVTTLGRIAGALYLLFGVLYVLGASLAAHTSSTSSTFSTAVGIELLANVAFVVTALALFVLLRRVNELAALAMVITVVMASAVGYAEAVIQYASHAVASPPGELEASSLFSGLWLIPLGCLVIKSGYFPRIVGALLLIGAASWLIQFFLYFFAPGLSVNVAVFQAGGVGELVFIAWLLIFSARPSASETSGSQTS
jgi:uncharacterized protein DUF4386